MHRIPPRPFALLAFVSMLSASASGQDADPAATLFRDGREAAKRGDYAAACPKFEQSFAAAAKVGTLFNLADCQYQTGKRASSLLSYQRVREMLPPGDERLPVTDERIAELQKRVARLTITGPIPKDASVRRDGQDVPSADIGRAVVVDAGGHVVTVTRSGHPEKRFELVLQEGEGRSLVVAEVETGSHAAPASAATPPASKPRDAVGPSAGAPEKSSHVEAYALLGVGAVGLAVSAVTGVIAYGDKQTMSQHCNASVQCDSRGLGAADSGKRMSTISTVGFAVGVVGLGVGSYMLWSVDGKTAAGISPGSIHLRRTF